LGIFKIGSRELFARRWLWTAILLISASSTTRIIGVSHQHLAWTLFCITLWSDSSQKHLQFISLFAKITIFIWGGSFFYAIHRDIY
jgi:hypothetical protein